MNIKNIARQLKGMTVENRRKVSVKTGVPYTTINNIAYGMTKNPRIETALALMRALK